MRTTRILGVVALCLILASVFVYASQTQLNEEQWDVKEPVSGDLIDPARQRLSLTASKAEPGITAAAAVTEEDVGDVNSFGRKLKWLGVSQANLQLSDDCTDVENCQVIVPSPGVTSFSIENQAAIQLPGKAAHSLLCHWFSPVLHVWYENETASPALARFRYSPTLTVESPVLDDPALIDLSTGLPFNGKLLTAMTASEDIQVPLEPGERSINRTRDTATCIAGFLNHESLVGTYGLTDAQAKEVFKKPIRVSMNVSGTAQHVFTATMTFGFRIVGD